MARDSIVGLTLGGRAWEWTILARNRERWEVTGQGEAAVPTTTQPEGAAGVPMGVPEAWADAAKTISGPVTIGLPSDALLLRVISLPTMAEEELPGAVQLQADKFSPFPTETMVISHEVLQRTDTAVRVLVAGVREETVNALTASLRQSGCVPRRVDVAIVARWHLLRQAGKTASAGRQFLLFDEGGSIDLIVQEDGIPLLFRSFEVPADAGDMAGQELASEMHHTLMSVELEHGSPAQVSASLWCQDPRGSILAPVLRDLFPGGVTVGRLEELTAVSHGLALRSAEERTDVLNLAPAAWYAAGEVKRFRRRMILVSVSIVGVWLLLVLVLFGGLGVEQWLLGRLQAEADAIKEPAMQVRETRRRVGRIRRYLENRHSALECLRVICEVQPAGIELTQFAYRKGEALKVSGDAGTVDQVYDFKRKLDGSDLLRENALVFGPSLDQRKGKYTFEIEIRLPGGEAS